MIEGLDLTNLDDVDYDDSDDEPRHEIRWSSQGMCMALLLVLTCVVLHYKDLNCGKKICQNRFFLFSKVNEA